MIFELILRYIYNDWFPLGMHINDFRWNECLYILGKEKHSIWLGESCICNYRFHNFKNKEL